MGRGGGGEDGWGQRHRVGRRDEMEVMKRRNRDEMDEERCCMVRIRRGKRKELTK